MITSTNRYLEDRVAVRELIDRASDAINHAEWENLLQVSTEDVVWERLPPVPWKLEGRRAIREFLAKNGGTMEIISYTVNAASIDVLDPDHATSRSTMSELLRFKETGAVLLVVGTYRDTFTMVGAQWRFSRRTISPRYERALAEATGVAEGVGVGGLRPAEGAR